MNFAITAEHFELSPSNREDLMNALEKIGRLLKGESRVQLFLKGESPNAYEAILRVHYRHRDFTVRARGNRLLPLVKAVNANMMRQLSSLKEKRVRNRRAPLSSSGAA